MEKEKKSIIKEALAKLKKVYSFLNKDITGSKKSKNKKDVTIKNEEVKEENVFEHIENNDEGDKEKSIEAETIPEPKEVEANISESTKDVQHDNEVEEPIEAKEDEKITTKKILEIDNSNIEKNQEQADMQVTTNDFSLEGNNEEQIAVQEVIEREVIIEKKEPIYPSSETTITSIIRPDSVLSYLDDIVLQQERKKNNQVIKKVYKKNKNSHLISPE